MRLSELLKCVQPLFYEDGFDGYEYSAGGTFFFARYAGNYYGITAKHCLNRRNVETIRLFVNDSNQGEDFVPIRRVYTIDDPPSGATDWADLAFLELRDEHLTKEQKRAHWFVDFDYLMTHSVSLRQGDLLVTRGCPNSIGGIDYDTAKVRKAFFAVDGRYERPGDEPSTHIFEFSDLSQIAGDPNGMSGSPVFKLTKRPTGLDYCFVGVLQRANRQYKIGQFVDCSVVFNAVRIASAERR